jgi:hypothetical protein
MFLMQLMFKQSAQGGCTTLILSYLILCSLHISPTWHTWAHCIYHNNDVDGVLDLLV